MIFADQIPLSHLRRHQQIFHTIQVAQSVGLIVIK